MAGESKWGQIHYFIARDEVPLADVIPLPHHQLEAIRFAIEQHDGGKRLKPVFDALEGEFSYEAFAESAPI